MPQILSPYMALGDALAKGPEAAYSGYMRGQKDAIGIQELQDAFLKRQLELEIARQVAPLALPSAVGKMFKDQPVIDRRNLNTNVDTGNAVVSQGLARQVGESDDDFEKRLSEHEQRIMNSPGPSKPTAEGVVQDHGIIFKGMRRELGPQRTPQAVDGPITMDQMATKEAVDPSSEISTSPNDQIDLDKEIERINQQQLIDGLRQQNFNNPYMDPNAAAQLYYSRLQSLGPTSEMQADIEKAGLNYQAQAMATAARLKTGADAAESSERRMMLDKKAQLVEMYQKATTAAQQQQLLGMISQINAALKKAEIEKPRPGRGGSTKDPRRAELAARVKAFTDEIAKRRFAQADPKYMQKGKDLYAMLAGAGYADMAQDFYNQHATLLEKAGVKPGAIKPPAASPQKAMPKSGQKAAPKASGKQEVGRQYSASRNQTKVIYSDGSSEIINGR
jgi:hypothetical protein